MADPDSYRIRAEVLDAPLLGIFAVLRLAREKHEENRYEMTRSYKDAADRARIMHQEDKALYEAIDNALAVFGEP